MNDDTKRVTTALVPHDARLILHGGICLELSTTGFGALLTDLCRLHNDMKAMESLPFLRDLMESMIALKADIAKKMEGG